ncbi:AaceriABL136Cp [[Ashbya] aceris (nom. inval.)]|nr:AaceriABL136Cp [[Ashbya] aceris (nom. inval.)]
MFSKSLAALCRIRCTDSIGIRSLTSSATLRAANSESSGSIFGSITKEVQHDESDGSKLTNRLAAQAGAADGQAANAKDSVTLATDKALQDYILARQRTVRSPAAQLLSPLKQRLYAANCAQNGGVYKKDTVVKLPGSSARYQVKLTRDELDALEPSVYVRSYRIESSIKKATVLLRLLGGLDVKKALTQCHFSDKKVARDVAELLQRGLEDGKELGLDPNDLYIAQIWAGSDGQLQKRPDFKGRGRQGVIVHPRVHIRCILKTKSITKKRLEHERLSKELNRKPWVQLASKPVRGSTGGVYKW